MKDLEQLAEQIAQRVAKRVVELLPTDPIEWSRELAAQANAERERVRALVALINEDTLRARVADYLDGAETDEHGHHIDPLAGAVDHRPPHPSGDLVGRRIRHERDSPG